MGKTCSFWVEKGSLRHNKNTLPASHAKPASINERFRIFNLQKMNFKPITTAQKESGVKTPKLEEIKAIISIKAIPGIKNIKI